MQSVAAGARHAFVVVVLSVLLRATGNCDRTVACVAVWWVVECCVSMVGCRVLRKQAKRHERDSEQRRCISVRVYLKRILETVRDNANTSTLRQGRAAALIGR